jgi:hypothetical protein
MRKHPLLEVLPPQARRCPSLVVLKVTPGSEESPDGPSRTEYHRCVLRDGHDDDGGSPHRYEGME